MIGLLCIAEFSGVSVWASIWDCIEHCIESKLGLRWGRWCVSHWGSRLGFSIGSGILISSCIPGLVAVRIYSCQQVN